MKCIREGEREKKFLVGCISALKCALDRERGDFNHFQEVFMCYSYLICLDFLYFSMHERERRRRRR